MDVQREARTTGRQLEQRRPELLGPGLAAEPRPAAGERRTVLLRIPLGMEKIRHACTVSDAPRAKTPRRRTHVSLATRAAPASPGYAGGSSNPDIGPRRQHSAVFRAILARRLLLPGRERAQDAERGDRKGRRPLVRGPTRQTLA